VKIYRAPPATGGARLFFDAEFVIDEIPQRGDFRAVPAFRLMYAENTKTCMRQRRQ
jgi:hypothetical protein